MLRFSRMLEWIRRVGLDNKILYFWHKRFFVRTAPSLQQVSFYCVQKLILAMVYDFSKMFVLANRPLAVSNSWSEVFFSPV